MEDDIAQDNEPLRSEKGEVLMGGGHWERLHGGWGQKRSRTWLQTSHPSWASHLRAATWAPFSATSPFLLSR